MEWQIRLVILLIGAALVGYVVWDYQRKKKRQKEQERLIEKLRAEAESVDAAGFDGTGVGRVRKVVIESQQTTDPDQNPDAEVQPPPAVERTPETIKSEPAKSEPAKVVTQPELVFTLILRADAGHSYAGKDFMPLLLSQGLRHGDLGIFHRHQKSGQGTSTVLYSVANAVEPGTFNLDGIESFTTPAFAFFMTIPGPEDPQAAYEAMVRTARLLESELGGKLIDDAKSVYSQQTHQHRIDQIKEYLAKDAIKAK